MNQTHWPVVFGYGPQGADYGWLFARNDVITLLDLLFFHQCPTGMEGSGYVILCLCLCNFAALVGDSKPIFNACQKKSFIWIIFQLPFPFRCFGCNRLVITETFTREWVLGFKRAIALERGRMSYLILWSYSSLAVACCWRWLLLLLIAFI